MRGAAAYRMQPVRDRLAAAVKLLPARRRMWTDQVNAKARAVQFPGPPLAASASQLLQEVEAPGLRAVPAPWGLPCWPTAQRAQAVCRRSWVAWCSTLRLHSRVRA